METLKYKIIKSKKQYFEYCDILEQLLDLKKKGKEIKDEIELLTLLIEKWDKENDLAMVATAADVKPFQLSEWAPLEGYWVMTVGAPEAIEASVTIGYIMNYMDNELYYTAPISGGNSGGPLIDNEGRVVGTVTASAIDSDFNWFHSNRYLLQLVSLQSVLIAIGFVAIGTDCNWFHCNRY